MASNYPSSKKREFVRGPLMPQKDENGAIIWTYGLFDGPLTVPHSSMPKWIQVDKQLRDISPLRLFGPATVMTSGNRCLSFEASYARLCKTDQQAVMTGGALPGEFVQGLALNIDYLARQLQKFGYAYLLRRNSDHEETDGTRREVFSLRWGARDATPFKQLQELSAAIDSRSSYKYHKRVLALTKTARGILIEALAKQSSTDVKAVEGFWLNQPYGVFVATPMPSKEFVSLAFPGALEIARVKARLQQTSSVVLRKRLTAAIFDAFVWSRFGCGDMSAPRGIVRLLHDDGLALVRHVEKIYSISISSHLGSIEDVVKNARKHMLSLELGAKSILAPPRSRKKHNRSSS